VIVEPWVVVVGAGGVGKTTVAAALAVASARQGRDTLVETFDPSQRLKDALGVGEGARERPVAVTLEAPGRLAASLLDAKGAFDRLVVRYAGGEAAQRRILHNRFYRHLSGSLAGVLEYMAVERLYELAQEKRYERVVLDTPPTAQALDFLDAPRRIVNFLDSGALRIALRPWFDEGGRLRPARRLGVLGRGVEAFFDTVVGLDLLRDMAEFFQALAPLFGGFRRRALAVEELLRRKETVFVLVASPAEERIPDTLFFARKLAERGLRLAAVVINRIHPPVPARPGREAPGWAEQRRLLAWLGERDARGVAALKALLGRVPVVELPMLEEEPASLPALEGFAHLLAARWSQAR